MGFFQKLKTDRQLKKAQKMIMIGKDKEAIVILDEIIEKSGKCSDVFLWNSIAYANLKDYEKAMQFIDKALAVDSKNHVNRMIKGEILHYMGQFDDSIKLLSDALDFSPDNTRITYFLGLNHLKKGDIEKASSFFETAIRYDRELVESRLLCAAELYLHKNS